MNKVIVAVFNDETDAYKGLSAMKDLHREGAITLYSQVVIAKDDKGEISTKDVNESGSVGTALGVTLGGLIGLLGGPAAALAGAYGGSLAGLVYDVNKAGVDVQFIDDVSAELLPGTTAILADIEEQWTAPLDTKIAECNGILFRKLRTDVEDEQLEREMEQMIEALEQLEAELRESSEKVAESIDKDIEASKKKLKEFADKAAEKQEKLDKELDERIKTLNEQRKEASEKNKAKIDAMIEKLKTDHDARVGKLKRAWEAAKSELAK